MFISTFALKNNDTFGIMKKLFTTISILLLIFFVASGCEEDKMEGKLVLKMDVLLSKDVADPHANIYNILNLENEIANVHFAKDSKQAEITLNVGDYAVQPVGWHMYPLKSFQIRQGQTTIVEYSIK